MSLIKYIINKTPISLLLFYKLKFIPCVTFKIFLKEIWLINNSPFAGIFLYTINENIQKYFTYTFELNLFIELRNLLANG